LAALNSQKESIGFVELISDDQVAKVSLIGAGMKSHPGVSANFFRALADAKVNIEMISTSEIRISVVVRAQDAENAVRAVHTKFGLDNDERAVVYGGTGR
jgi:aspartate kinase